MVSGEERPASSGDPDGTRVLEVTWRTQNSRETRIGGRRLGKNGEEASDGAATEPRVAIQPAQQREAEGIERAIYGEHRGDVEPEGQSGEGGSREAADDHLDGRREGAADGDDGRAGEGHADERAPRPGVRVAAAAGDNGQDEAGVVEVDGRREDDGRVKPEGGIQVVQQQGDGTDGDVRQPVVDSRLRQRESVTLRGPSERGRTQQAGDEESRGGQCGSSETVDREGERGSQMEGTGAGNGVGGTPRDSAHAGGSFGSPRIGLSRSTSWSLRASRSWVNVPR